MRRDAAHDAGSESTGLTVDTPGRILYTVGTGDASAAQLLAALRHHGIETLVDIRDRAAGRKGFNRSELEVACKADGIGYCQVRDLGAPAALRKDHDQETEWEGFQAAYAEHLRHHKEAFLALKAHVLAARTVVLCRCAHPARCERGVVAGLFLRAGYGVRHLTVT